MESINKHQVKIIHTLKQKLGLSDTDYRSVLSGWNARSSLDLNKRQATDMIKLLSDRAEKAGVWFPKITGFDQRKRQPRFEHLGKRPGMATPGQLRKIEALWMSVSRQPTRKEKRIALNHFLENHFDISMIEWVPFEKVGKIIRTLEAMQKQETNYA